MIPTDELQPLGIFAIGGLDQHPERGADLISPLVGLLATDPQLVASYLRGGYMVLPWMGASGDVLGDRFVVMGGVAIMTDGRFFWRYDTADYVEHYRVELPQSFIEHGDSLAWVPPKITPEEEAVLNTAIGDYYRSSADFHLWFPNDPSEH